MDTSTLQTPDSPWTLIGLDGEMSSADIEDGGKLIQAGAAAWADQPGGQILTFTRTIRQPDMAWSERAAQVHGLTREEIAAAPPADEVDAELREWLLANGAVDGRRMVVPIGLNVAAFDMPFFRQSLPDSSRLIARRAVDLNAMCYAFAGWDPNPNSATARDFAGWKRSMKTSANRFIASSGVAVREHDAGYDAAQALVSLWWLQGQLADSTRIATRALEQASDADPLLPILGAGLRDRLAGVDRADLGRVIAALGPDVPVKTWFGRGRSTLGSTPLQALLDGRVEDVIAAARAATSVQAGAV